MTTATAAPDSRRGASDASRPPTLLWLRRDLRLADHPVWQKALGFGGPVVPVFVRDPLFDRTTGAASAWRMGRALDALARDLAARGSRLILRRGGACEALEDLIAETGARRVVWGRAWEGRRAASDGEVASALAARGVETAVVADGLLFDPRTVTTGTGGYYRVYTPFRNAVRRLEVAAPVPAPADLAPPPVWPRSDRLADWALGARMRRGAGIVARRAPIGEAAASARLDAFIADGLDDYRRGRDFMTENATSRLSAHLACGEISPRSIWRAVRCAVERRPEAAEGAERFLDQIVWREFARHLLHHAPDLETRNFKPEWDEFPWRGDNPDAARWKRGMTGIEIVDAAMREMYVSGVMHNRCRMLVGNFLTRHLATHWRVGEAWFRECLIDWDPAANAMGWQWASGAGPDAVPYFRIFNPDLQAAKFDAERRYRDRWLAEGRRNPHPDALSWFDAVPESWGLHPRQPYPPPVISAAAGRARALAALAAMKEKRGP